MSKVIKLLPFLLFCFYFTYAQAFDWKSHEVKSDTDLLKAVVHTATTNFPIEDDKWASGTAFFYFNTFNHKLYLVVNKHEIYGYDTLIIMFKNKEFSSLQYPYQELGVSNFKNAAIYSNGGNTDLALIDLSKTNFDMNDFGLKCFTEKNIPDENISKKIQLDSKVYDIGFPYGASVKKWPYFIPCTLATLYYIDWDDEKEFGVNGNIVEGCSGSPIIYKPKNNEYLILGIDSFGIGQNENITDSNGKKLKFFYMSNALINQCVKSSEIIKLINQQ